MGIVKAIAAISAIGVIVVGAAIGAVVIIANELGAYIDDVCPYGDEMNQLDK